MIRSRNFRAGQTPLFSMLALAGALALCAGRACGFDLSAERQPLDAAFSRNLETLAEKCLELGLEEQARVTREWIVRRNSRRQYLFLPADSDTTRPTADAPDLVRKWHARFREHRNAQAEGLFALARQAAAAGETVAAYQLLHEVLREDPDHSQTRKVLGYLPPKSGVWPRAGAISAVRPSAAPLPFLGGRSWKAETTNYSVSTNHSANAAQQAAAELEKLHDAWRQLFAQQWLEEGELKTRLETGRPPALPKAKKQVTLFKSREDYLDKLGREVPGLELSKGFYSDSRQIVFLYVEDGRIRTTWYHEATHQLFHQTGRVGSAVGIKENCWIIEGIAMYLESLVFYDGYCTVGGFDAERLQDARYRAKIEGFHRPLAELARLGRDALQRDPDVRKLYSQSAGLVHFLMDDRGGKYRRALSEYLAAVYQGRDTADSLSRLTGASLSDLDVEYRGSLNVTDEDLAWLNPSPHARVLRLARTAVTDKGLKHLAGHPELEVLDLSGLAVTDAGLSFLADSKDLKELMLDGTSVTDASLAAIGQLKRLETLDLANLPITDEGLAQLANLKKLNTLYLTNTRVTDAGLARLTGLSLETLDVEGAAVSPAAVKRLMK